MSRLHPSLYIARILKVGSEFPAITSSATSSFGRAIQLLTVTLKKTTTCDEVNHQNLAGFRRKCGRGHLPI